MKGMKTPKDILAQTKMGQWHYGFVRRARDRYHIAAVKPGVGFEPIITLEMSKKEAARFFSDLYQQLKGLFEGISEHH